MNQIYSIDRFEGDFAVCEDKITGEMINIPKYLLDLNCKEGDIIKFENGLFVTDIVSTQKAKEEIQNLSRSLFKRKNNDI